MSGRGEALAGSLDRIWPGSSSSILNVETAGEYSFPCAELEWQPMAAMTNSQQCSLGSLMPNLTKHKEYLGQLLDREVP